MFDLEPSGYSLAMADADVYFYPAFFEAAIADSLFEDLTQKIRWREDKIKLFGRLIDQPRRTAWYGDSGCAYSYSGITMQPEDWTPELLLIRHRVEERVGIVFNSVLLNQYRSERDSVSWHSDDEKELGMNPVIASVSFGATRRFQFKHKSTPEKKAALDLTHGSFLLMSGTTQQFWLHQIPKSARTIGPRINLTFRTIVS